jgi:hypothetical protein
MMKNKITREYITELLRTNDKVVAHALVALNKRQTSDEQGSKATRWHNGQGFMPMHARMGTSMAQFYERNGYLSPKQIAYWRRVTPAGKPRIEKYVGQLLLIAQEKAAQ